MNGTIFKWRVNVQNCSSFQLFLTCINNHINEIHTFSKSITQIDMMEGYDASFALSAIQCFSSLQSFITSHLIFIKFSEIINNDRNGQCDYQDAANTTYWANDFPKRCRGTYITILYTINFRKIKSILV